MKPINDQNVDEIMFRLLEGEITGKEREQLLNAIQADPAYSALWNTWQNTVLKPEQLNPDLDTAILKKKSGTVLAVYFRWAVAAMLVLGLGIGMYFSSDDSSENKVSISLPSKNRNTPVYAVPPIARDTHSALKTPKDSLLPLKMKVRYMANRTQSENAPDTSIGLQSELVQNNIKMQDAPLPLIPLTDSFQIQSPVSFSADHVIVSVSNENADGKTELTKKKRTLFAWLFGASKIKIEDDKNTRTQKKIIIENKKYQIIAGF